MGIGIIPTELRNLGLNALEAKKMSKKISIIEQRKGIEDKLVESIKKVFLKQKVF